MTKILVKLLATSALLSPAAVWAQEAPADEGGLDEIIVTAQKREEGLSRVPISISAVGGKRSLKRAPPISNSFRRACRTCASRRRALPTAS